jgi:hypothetical protein
VAGVLNNASLSMVYFSNFWVPPTHHLSHESSLIVRWLRSDLLCIQQWSLYLFVILGEGGREG